MLIHTTDFTITSYVGRFIRETNSEASVPAGAVEAEMTYEEMFREIAPQYGLDWHLLAQVAYQESRFNPRAVGKDDDTGLMQIIPSTWNEWAPKVGVSDPFDPYSNVHVAAAYLAFLRKYFTEMGYPEDRWMLVAYNWGPDNLRRLLEDGGGWEQVPEKRRRYALRILRAVSDTPPGWEEIRDEIVMGRNLTKPALSIE
jgi:soluble lytic murein transglycosylase-like protein